MRKLNAITLLVFALIVIAPAVCAQTRARRVDPSGRDRAGDVEIVRIDTTLVTIPVSVIDNNGRSISDLQKDDFHIYENGVEQEIAHFATVEKPFTVVLMLDTSASTWSKLGQIKDAAKAFVEQLRPEDQVMVVSFGMGFKVQCEPTSDRRRIRKGIEGTSRGLSTRLYDAVDKVMRKHLNRIQGRKAVVLFTDGVDATSNDSTYESTVHAAQELDALIYSIRYDTYDPANDKGPVSDPSSGVRLPSILRKIPLPLPTIGSSSSGGAGSSRADYDRGERYLHELAELTGGRVYEANKDLRNLKMAFTQIADELGRQYSLGYYPQKKGVVGQARQIKVRINKPDVVVRSRGSYIYQGSQSGIGSPATPTETEKKSTSSPVLKKNPLTGGL